METALITQEEINQFGQNVRGLIAKATAMGIASHEDAELVTEHRRKIKDSIVWIKDKFKRPKKSAKKAHQDVCDLESSFVDPLEERYDAMGAALLKWHQDEADRVAKEAARIQEEARRIAEKSAADQKAKIESQRLEIAAKLEEAGFGEEAEALIEKPIEVAVSIAIPEPVAAAATIKGQHTRKKPKAKLVDLEALVAAAAKDKGLLSLLSLDQKEADERAKSLGREMRIPGLEFYEEESLVDRG